MCPMYEYLCQKCDQVNNIIVDMDDRNNPQECLHCRGVALKVMFTAPGVRTAKTSRTFLDGGRKDGYNEEIKAAGLDAEAMNHNPSSDKYRELKAEAKARRLLNNTPDRPKSRYKLDGKKTIKKENK